MSVATEVRDVLVIGSGPAGYTAAIYLARADLTPLVFEGFQYGGALMTTTEVENFPGFADGIQGPDLMAAMRTQAERFGADLRMEDVDRVDLSGPVKRAWVDGIEYAAPVRRAGHRFGRPLPWPAGRGAAGRPRRLRLRDLRRLLLPQPGRRGRSAAATRRWRRPPSSPGSPARVTIVHRRDSFRASAIMLDRARANPKIRWETNAAGRRGPRHRRGHRPDAGGHRHRCEQRELRRHRHVRRDRPRSPVGAVRRPDRPRPGRLRADRGADQPDQSSTACSPAAIWSTTPTGRRSPRPAPAVPPRWTPSTTWPITARHTTDPEPGARRHRWPDRPSTVRPIRRPDHVVN